MELTLLLSGVRFVISRLRAIEKRSNAAQMRKAKSVVAETVQYKEKIAKLTAQSEVAKDTGRRAASFRDNLTKLIEG